MSLDVVVVGGGPAGLSTALHLQRAAPGLRVVVLEKERYPRDKICAGGIGARAFRILGRLGLEVDCPCVPLNALAIRLATETLEVRIPELGAVVRRIEFDHALARAAVARGVDVREGVEVTALEVGDREVVVTTAAGDRLVTRVVVGADGVAGPVRRLAGFARAALRAQVVELDTEGVPADHPRDTVVFDFATAALRGYAWDFPTQVGGAPLVCRGVYVLHDGQRRPDPGEPRTRLAAYLAARGLDIAHYKVKQFAEQGFAPGAAIARPRVLLAGEAAGIDIATGEGIGQAIEYGMLAGRYLARAFADGNVGFDDWRTAIERHHLGFQMAVRHGCYRAFYGRRRAAIERMMPRLTHLLRAGVADFAGAPVSRLALMRGAGQLIAAMADYRS